VILGLDGEPLGARIFARLFRHGPRRERAVDLEAQIVVMPARVMIVNDELSLAQGVTGRSMRGRATRGT
jgi:hypothetical protein